MALAWQSWRLRLGALWLAWALACIVWAGLQLFAGQKLETNLLALLPPTERNPRAELAVNKLSEMLGNRALFLIGHRDADTAHTLSRRFAERLRHSGAFKQVHDTAPKADAGILLDFYRPYRSALLTPSDSTALAKPDFDPAARLTRRLHQPFAGGLATPLGDDPLGFWQQWLSNLPLTQSRLSVESEQLVARENDVTWVLVLADLSGSAYDDKTQNAVTTAVAVAKAEITPGGAQLLHTGGVFYGAAARSTAEREVDFIGAGSLIGILLMMAWLFRSLRPLGLAMLTVAIGLGCALAATLAVFGQLHLITLVFGASLIGEAVDYAIQYFAAQLDAGKDWEPISGLQRIVRGLAVALATSLIGYGALALSPFPAIGQIALFAFTGLAGAWISVVLLLPLLTQRAMTRDVASATRLPRALLDLWCRKMTPRRAGILIALLLLLALPGLLKLQGNDDIRLLISRPAALQAEEAKIRQLAGFTGSTRFYLVEGKDWEEVLQREEDLSARLVAAGWRAPLSVSTFVPSHQRQLQNHARQQTLLAPPHHLERTLAAAEFRDDLAQHWIAELRAQVPLLTPDQWLTSPFSQPYRYLVAEGEGTPATLVIPQSDEGQEDFSAIGEGLPGITPVDKGASVSKLFHQYRVGASKWLPLAILIVAAVLALRYGMRNGAAVLLPTLLGMGLALALYGYTGQPLTLFSLMGLMLVLGVGANYAIFLFEAGDRAPASFAGVLLSAATTLLSFGLLALSSMPALKHFGLMLLTGITASVILAPLALTLGKTK